MYTIDVRLHSGLRRLTNAAPGTAEYPPSTTIGRTVTGRVWDGNAGRALPVDPSDRTQIDHDKRPEGAADVGTSATSQLYGPIQATRAHGL